MQFGEFSILTIVQEDATGTRVLEEAVRIWPESAGRPPQQLGRPEYRPHYVPGTREVETATISFSPPGGDLFEVTVRPVNPVSLMVGTGYGRSPTGSTACTRVPNPSSRACATTCPRLRTKPGCGA